MRHLAKAHRPGLIAAKLTRPDRYQRLSGDYEEIAESKFSAAQKRQFNYLKFVDALDDSLSH